MAEQTLCERVVGFLKGISAELIVTDGNMSQNPVDRSSIATPSHVRVAVGGRNTQEIWKAFNAIKNYRCGKVGGCEEHTLNAAGASARYPVGHYSGEFDPLDRVVSENGHSDVYVHFFLPSG